MVQIKIEKDTTGKETVRIEGDEIRLSSNISSIITGLENTITMLKQAQGTGKPEQSQFSKKIWEGTLREVKQIFSDLSKSVNRMVV